MITSRYSTWKLNQRLRSILYVLQKTGRILTGESVQYRTVTGSNMFGLPAGVPSATDGVNVYFNDQDEHIVQAAERMLESDMVLLKGLSYHELSHVLFTPRHEDEIVKWVRSHPRSAEMFQVFNILEDQRIEMLFTAMYPPAEMYFKFIVSRWIVRGELSTGPGLLPLVHGRKYLPMSLRRAAYASFAKAHGADTARRLVDLIDRYLTVTYPYDTAKGRTIAQEVWSILFASGVPLVSAGDIHCNVQEGGPRNGRLKAKRARKVAKDLEEKLEDIKNEESSDEDVDSSDASDEPDQSDEQDTGQGSGGQEASDGASASDDGTDDGTPSDEQGGVGGTGGNGAGTESGDWSSINDIANEALEDVLNDRHVVRDAQDIVQAVQQVESSDGSLGDRAPSKTEAPKPEVAGTQRRIYEVLRRIMVDLEPSWLRRETTGKINMRRIMTAEDHRIDVFDRWDEGGDDDVRFEVVLLVDQSGSMGGRNQLTSEMVWMFKRVFDDLDFKTTVLGYTTDYSVMYSANQRCARGNLEIFAAQGGTDPTAALREAERIFKSSSMPKRLLVNVTDGQWAGNGQEIVANLTKQGVITMLLGLNGAADNYGPRGHHIVHPIVEITDVIKAATDLVRHVMSTESIYHQV